MQRKKLPTINTLIILYNFLYFNNANCKYSDTNLKMPNQIIPHNYYESKKFKITFYKLEVFSKQYDP